MFLQQLLVHDPRVPLVFNSGTFFLIFTAFVLVYALLPDRRSVRLGWTLTFSLYYYYRCNGLFVAALLGTVALDFALMHLMARARRPWLRRGCLGLSLGLSLSLLCYYKYLTFILEQVTLLTGASFALSSLVAPIGISFFTFQSISYMLDVYRGREVPTPSPLEYLLFRCFFPQIVAGPLTRGSELLPQLRALPAPSRAMAAEGLYRILQGLAKKALLADYLGRYCDLVFGAPSIYSGPEIVLGVYAYALEIYLDFSGYSDMAIGMARILGITLPENFASPYTAPNLAEFWRRWHMTLSRWVRDYLFTPFALASGRRPWARYATFVLVMTLVGLWHGASYGFVLWGLAHGLGLAAQYGWSRRRRARALEPEPWRVLVCSLLTFHFVALAWVLFRAPTLTTIGQLAARLGVDWELSRCVKMVHARSAVLVALVLGAVACLAPARLATRLAKPFVRAPALVKALVFLVMVQAVLQVQGSEVQPFIYFQF